MKTVERQIIKDDQLEKLIREGWEVTSDNPDRLPNWGKVDMTTSSYMGMKLFLNNGKVYMQDKVRGIKSPTGEIRHVQVARR